MAINPTPFSPKTSKKKVNPLYIMLTIALFLGLTAAFGIWQYLNKTQKQVKEFTKTKAIVVAAKEIMSGEKITTEDLTLKEVPIQTIPEGSLENPTPIVGRIAKGTIGLNEILNETKLLAEGSAAGLPGIIPPGQRAITIKVNDVIGVGGFIKPGDRVDIISIKRGDETISKIILQNVLVIAVGEALYDPNMVAAPTANVVPQITVALDTTNSEKLALASSSSQLHLVLRPHGESTIAYSKGVNLEEIYSDFEEEVEETEEEIIDVIEPKDSIDIILGGKRTTYFYY